MTIEAPERQMLRERIQEYTWGMVADQMRLRALGDPVPVPSVNALERVVWRSLKGSGFRRVVEGEGMTGLVRGWIREFVEESRP
jgi:hypothetical protein